MEVNLCRDAEASGSLEADFTQCAWELETLETTQQLGQHLAKQLPRGSILLLKGQLGAGKTSLVQGLATGLGITEAVTSPTFALAQHYCRPTAPQQPVLVHLDLYRLELPEAADELFAQEEELAAECGALLAVEWPESLSFSPNQAWQLQLIYCNGGRQLLITPPAAAR